MRLRLLPGGMVDLENVFKLSGDLCRCALARSCHMAYFGIAGRSADTFVVPVMGVVASSANLPSLRSLVGQLCWAIAKQVGLGGEPA